MRKILKSEDLMEIVTFFIEKGYDSNIEIGIDVGSKSMLRKVNEDFHYKCDKTDADFDPDADEVKVNMGGYVFRYFAREN